ncbi:hypothetical protein LJC56_02795 [Christensenellaceae bacterium OttesenSCG-928-K19]|nr:hypothetical protein [Christensenellaceae bacterium OttesenSCG-928-K19]
MMKKMIVVTAVLVFLTCMLFGCAQANEREKPQEIQLEQMELDPYGVLENGLLNMTEQELIDSDPALKPIDVEPGMDQSLSQYSTLLIYHKQVSFLGKEDGAVSLMVADGKVEFVTYTTGALSVHEENKEKYFDLFWDVIDKMEKEFGEPEVARSLTAEDGSIQEDFTKEDLLAIELSGERPKYQAKVIWGGEYRPMVLLVLNGSVEVPSAISISYGPVE